VGQRLLCLFHCGTFEVLLLSVFLYGVVSALLLYACVIFQMLCFVSVPLTLTYRSIRVRG